MHHPAGSYRVDLFLLVPTEIVKKRTKATIIVLKPVKIGQDLNKSSMGINGCNWA